MKFAKMFAAAVVAMGIGSTSVLAASTATVDLSSFLQNLTITNNAGSTASINQVVYSLGTAGDGIATWDLGTAGGVASDFLSNPRYFQTVTFAANIAAGSSTSFGGLDIDLINVLNPLNVTGSTLNEQNVDPGISLTNAFVSVFWNDGTSGTTSLTNQIWSLDQQLSVSNMSAVPLPAGLPLLLSALGLVGFIRFRKRAA